MSRLLTTGNVALFEYPECPDPEFDLDSKGVLFITGYEFRMGPLRTIGAANRFELGLKNATVVGKYNSSTADPELTKLVTSQNLDQNNLLVIATHNP